MDKRFSVKKHTACFIVMLLSLSVILATGCSTTVYAKAGELSMPCPQGLHINSENKMNSPVLLPDTMECRDNTMLTNDDGSIVVVLVEVGDPQSLGIGDIDAYWREILSNPLSEDKIAEMDDKFPGMGDMIENTVIQGPELLDLGGRNALMVSRTYREASREVVYYIEVEGEVVGSIEIVSTVAFFESDPNFLNDVVYSVEISNNP